MNSMKYVGFDCSDTVSELHNDMMGLEPAVDFTKLFLT